MGAQYKNRDKVSSFKLQAPSGVDKRPEQHYLTTLKQLSKGPRSSTEEKFLPVVQKKTLNQERGVNSIRNNKVSVLAMNNNASPLNVSDYGPKDQAKQ